MSDELEHEDLSALAVLEDLAHGAGQEDTAPVEPPPADDAAEVLRRLYVEGLGLLAYDLLPAQPRPGTRATVLAHLIGDETQEVSPLMIGAAHNGGASPPATPRTAASRPPAAEPAAATEALRPAEGKRPPESAATAGAHYGEAQARRATPRSRWPAALATLLAHRQPLMNAVRLARGFVRGAIEQAPGFGAGHGPLGHQAVRSLAAGAESAA